MKPRAQKTRTTRVKYLLSENDSLYGCVISRESIRAIEEHFKIMSTEFPEVNWTISKVTETVITKTEPIE